MESSSSYFVFVNIYLAYKDFSWLLPESAILILRGVIMFTSYCMQRVVWFVAIYILFGLKNYTSGFTPSTTVPGENGLINLINFIISLPC